LFLFAKQTNPNLSNTGGQRYSDTSPFSIPWIGQYFARLMTEGD